MEEQNQQPIYQPKEFKHTKGKNGQPPTYALPSALLLLGTVLLISGIFSDGLGAVAPFFLGMTLIIIGYTLLLFVILIHKSRTGTGFFSSNKRRLVLFIPLLIFVIFQIYNFTR